METIKGAILTFLRANPGSRIEQIKSGIGYETKELSLPMKKLIAAKAVRAEGQKRAPIARGPVRVDCTGRRSSLGAGPTATAAAPVGVTGRDGVGGRLSAPATIAGDLSRLMGAMVGDRHSQPETIRPISRYSRTPAAKRSLIATAREVGRLRL